MGTGKKAGGVGEGRDAKGRVLPGYTPNPAGGGRRANPLEALIREILAEERSVTVNEDGKKVSVKMPLLEMLVRQYLQRATLGDRNSFREMLDRGFGKPRQTLDVGGQDGEGIKIIIGTNGSGGNGDGKGKT